MTSLRRSDERPSAETGGLRRVISFWDATALVAGLIIGSGIFRAPASVAAELPTAALMLAAWVVGGLLSLAGALAVAELGVRYPQSGGQFVFLRAAFGPSAAFSFGWTTVLISRPSLLAGIATVFATYFAGLFGLGTSAEKPAAIAAAIVFTFVNCLGVKSGTRTQNLFTAAKAAGLLVMAAAAFASLRGDWGHFAAAPAPGLGGGAAHSLPVAMALGLVTILYTYDGWIDVTYVGGEVARPARDIPRSIFLGTGVCILLYLLANAAYIYLMPVSEMTGAENIAGVALSRAFGPAGGAVLSALVVVSTLGILNGSMLTGARVPFAMAHDGMLPAPLGRVHARTGSPVNTLLLQGVLTVAVLLFAKGFDEVATLFVSTTWFFYAVSIAGLLVIRRRERRGGAEKPAAYRMPLSPWPAILFIVVTLFTIGSDLAVGGPRGLAGMAIVAAAVPAYYAWRGARRAFARRGAAGGPA
jgi:amino acid transporter